MGLVAKQNSDFWFFGTPYSTYFSPTNPVKKHLRTRLVRLQLTLSRLCILVSESDYTGSATTSVEQTKKVLSFSETELALLRSYNGGAASLLSLLHVQFCDMWILGKSDFQSLDYHDVILIASPHLTTTCNKTFDFSSKKKDFVPKNDQIWLKIGIFVHFVPGLAGSFGALLVGWLVVVARGLYLARHLFTLLSLKANMSEFLFV